jgi:5-methyltetrahydrofolate--homocysteine methyltransferase
MKFLEALHSKRLFFEGSLFTMLQASGLPFGEPPELWNLSHPEVVQASHEEYVRRGADILKTNTFEANSFVFSSEKNTPSVSEIVEAAVYNARRALQMAWKDGYVALTIGPLGRVLEPYGDLPFEAAVNCFAELVEAGEKAGVDLILIQTMRDTYETKAAMLAAREHSSLPMIVTYTFDENGKLLNGADVETAMVLAEAFGATACGFNCGMAPAQMQPLVRRARKVVNLPLVVNPNCGSSGYIPREPITEIEPDEYAESMLGMVNDVSIMGGCCGTTPMHIEKVVNKVKHIPLPAIPNVEVAEATGCGALVKFEGMPVIIGERINPKGKPALREALLSHNMEYVCQLALEQVERGAQILDVNVYIPGTDEVALLTEVIKRLQSITSVPLMIDTANVEAMDQALRIYNGRPILNSVNGSKASLQKVLPLAKKYGALVVGICMDENDIPHTYEERMAIALKIIDAAKQEGIPEQDLLIDPITVPVGTGAQNGQMALKIVSELKRNGIKSILGISNISYGLPYREAANCAFFAEALEAGLSAAILNTNQGTLMGTYVAHGAIRGFDEGFRKYIAYFEAVPGDAAAPRPMPKISVLDTGSLSLREAVEKGYPKATVSAVQKLLDANEKPLDIIDGDISEAMDAVNAKFKEKEIYLPQLLMSAEAAKAAFDMLNEKIDFANVQGKDQPEILLATVQGNFQNVGKHILHTLLHKYGYTVTDLGGNVSAGTVVQEVTEHHVRVVALSALLPSAMPEIKKVIEGLHKAAPDCKIIMSGPMLTKQDVEDIGADFWAANAVEAMHFIQKVFENKK